MSPKVSRRDRDFDLGMIPKSACVVALLAPIVASAQDDGTDSERIIEEVIVTATRRAEPLQDVAVSVTTISDEAIEKRNLVGMQDYLRSTPGVSMQDRGAGQNAIIIRGISSDPQNSASTAGIYYGETPLTDSGGFRGGSPDIKLVDIERVEVLRGPQGTLFGEGSMSGAVRVIPNRPALDEFSGEVSATLSSTSGNGDSNSMLSGVVNLPVVEDSFAIRGSVYRFDNSGYHQNIAASDPVKSSSPGALLGAGLSDAGDIGNDEYQGLRLSALWQPQENLQLTVSYLDQEIEQTGLPESSLSLGDLQQARFDTDSGPESIGHDIELLNLELTYDLDEVTLFFTSSRLETDSRLNRDFGAFLAPLLGDDFPILLADTTDYAIDAHEFRAASSFGRFDGLLGLYHAQRDFDSGQHASWAEGALDPVFGGALLFLGDFSLDRTDKALFGELTYALTERWDATAGFRYYEYDEDAAVDLDGVFAGGPLTQSFVNTNDETTYKLGLSYSPNDTALHYLNVQEGYRAGRANQPTALCDLDNDGLVDGIGLASTPLKPDDLTSYEVGSKLSLKGGQLRLNAAAFLVDWNDMPVQFTSACGILYLFNAGKSESKGLEVEVSALLGANWTLDAGYSFTRVELAADGTLGNNGDRLPGSPENLFTLGAEYAFRLSGRDSYARLDWTHVDEYYNGVGTASLALGDYHEVRLSMGIDFERYALQFFVNNVTDSDEILWNDTEIGDGRLYKQRPRTVGMAARLRF